MEFPFLISQVIDINEHGFSLVTINSHQLEESSKPFSNTASKEMIQLINILGEYSREAQELDYFKINYDKWVRNQSSKIYIKADLHRIYGFLVIKPKEYSESPRGKNNFTLQCLTDFYVHDSVQRTGVGKVLFEKMLKMENLDPSQIAYKRPTSKLLSFLTKNYELRDPVSLRKDTVFFTSSGTPTARKSMQNQNSPQSSRNKNEKMSAMEIRRLKLKNKFTEKDGNNSHNTQIIDQTNKKSANLIDLLLKSPSLLENDILTKTKPYPTKVEGVDSFENDYAKKLYEDIYKWHWSLEQELKREEKYFEEKMIMKPKYHNKKS